MVFALAALLLPFAPQTSDRFLLDDRNSFPFVIPWDDAVAGTATDASFLNVKPAGKNGPIVVRNGVFVEQKSGKRVRFFGTNIGARAAFPPKADAPKIAKHLAKMGINIVRFHHLQNDWDLPHGTLWKLDKLHIEMDPVKLDLLDFFVAELKKQGIYINMNLQTSRKMVPELGVPASALEIKEFQKKVDKVNARMIEIQKEYANQLLGRVNRYTGKSYKDDPALMVIEINNENSLVGWPGESPGQGISKWPEPFKSEIIAKWNAFLRRKYRDDRGLERAWREKDNLKGPNLIQPGQAWVTENVSGGEVVVRATPIPGEPDALMMEVKSNPGPNWHIQAHLGGLHLQDNQVYTLQFEARADRNAAVNVDSRLDQPDWRFLGLGATIDLTPEWRTYSLSFTCQNPEPNHSRVGFVLGDFRGKIEVRKVSLRAGTAGVAIDPGVSLSSGTVPIPAQSMSQRSEDWAEFLVQTELAYGDAMRNHLRDELGFKSANIIDTQISWGELTGVAREFKSPFADNHAYWNHPTFLGSDWDPKNYRIDRRALVNDLGGGTLSSLMQYRIAGKPYSVSEYNHPAPSDFQAEMMPLYSGFGALQNWDVLYTFAWEPTGSREINDRYDGFFDMARNPAKKAFFPASALLFRLGLFEPLKRVESVGVTPETWRKTFTASGVWNGRPGKTGYLNARYALAPAGGDRSSEASGELTTRKIIGRENERGVLMESDKAIVVAGFTGGKTIELQAGSLRIGRTPTNFSAIMIVSKDGLPLKESKRILATVVGRIENRNMGWNAARDSVGDQWGDGPTRAEAVPVEFNLKGLKARTVYALDGNGKRARKVGSRLDRGELRFSVGMGTRSVWYEITE